MTEVVIRNVTPHGAIAGGEVTIDFSGPMLDGSVVPVVRFGDHAAHVTLAKGEQVIAQVPAPASESAANDIQIGSGDTISRPFPYNVGRRLASNLHPVANPAVDSSGNIFVTYSGSRGQKTPVSVYKVSSRGAVTPFVTDIMNATGLAFDADGQLYLSSRMDGNVYRVDPSGRVETYIEGMGVATGIAFDRDENLYIGDRSGTIFKISKESREVFVFATLEPSIAAYHLAFGFDDHLYVAGPSTSSFDVIHRVSPTGVVDRYFTGLGRPQGLAFDIEGRLYAVCSYRGRRGIFRFNAHHQPELFVSGMGLVGLAFDYEGHIIAADAGSIYSVPAGVLGKPLP